MGREHYGLGLFDYKPQVLECICTQPPQCDCEHDTQTANHIVEECPLCSIQGGMEYLHKATAAATNWVTNLNIGI